MARILVVDDESVILKLLDYRLTMSGYDVITALNGTEALEMTRNKKPDLVILDVALPEMDGCEICELLKKDERYAGIPVMMVTATAREESIKRGINAGADAYMTKPFESEELLSKIKELLEKKKVTGGVK